MAKNRTVPDPAGVGLAALRRIGGSGAIRQLRLDKPAEAIAYTATRTGFAAASAAVRRFKSVKARLSSSKDDAARLDGVFDLTPTEEQQMIRDGMQRLAEDMMRPAAHDADEACVPPGDILDAAAELGLLHMVVPEDMGGAAESRSPLTQALIAEDLAHGDMGLTLAILAPVAVAQTLVQWGSDDQVEQYLKPMLDEGFSAAALAINEPRPLFDPNILQTRAEKKRGDYVLNGIKHLVPMAEQSDFFIVAASLDDKPALFLVDKSATGLSVRKSPAMGLRAAGLGSIKLNRVRLKANALLGEGKEDFDYEQCLDFSHLAWCAMTVGTCQAALDYVIPYVNERKAFGEPVSHRQAVAFKVADMATEIEGMRLLTWKALSRAEREKDFHRETYLARLACAEYGMRIGSDAVQLLGGHGFVKEHPVERWYRDLRSIGITHGGVMV